MARRLTGRRGSARRPPAKRRRRGTRPDEAALRRALHVLAKDLHRISATSDRALQQLETLRVEGAIRYEEQLVRKAVADNLFGDLTALEAAFDKAPEAWPELAPFRAVPDALLIWAATELHLEPFMRAGYEGEMPASSVNKYDWIEPLPPPGPGVRSDGQVPPIAGPSFSSGGIVAFRVIEPGWKWRGRVVARPRLSVRNM